MKNCEAPKTIKLLQCKTGKKNYEKDSERAICCDDFFGMLFIPSLGMSEDNTMEKWMQDHTMKVNVATTCKYEQGYLLVKKVYTGEELKERFGIEQFTKELKIPVP